MSILLSNANELSEESDALTRRTPSSKEPGFLASSIWALIFV